MLINIDVVQSEKRVFKFVTDVSKGHIQAINAVGWYELEITKNYTKAYDYFMRAHKHGNPDASHNLGHMCMNGLVPGHSELDRVCMTMCWSHEQGMAMCWSHEQGMVMCWVTQTGYVWLCTRSHRQGMYGYLPGHLDRACNNYSYLPGHIDRVCMAMCKATWTF